MRWIVCVTMGLLASPAAAQTDPAVDARLETILDYSKADDVLGGQAEAVAALLRSSGSELDPVVLESAVALVAEEFSPALLEHDLLAFMNEEAEPGIVDGVMAWLETGANAEIQRVEASYEPPETLEEFTRDFATAGPPQARIQLFARWAASEGAGDFYVILEEAAREAAHGILSELEPGLPAFEPLTRQSYTTRHQQALQYAVVSFLHRFRPAPDDLIERAIAEYESEEGQWYIEAYTIGIAEAILNAGTRVAARVE